MMFDYLIVGAGLFGAVFAREATARGKRCLVVAGGLRITPTRYVAGCPQRVGRSSRRGALGLNFIPDWPK
jgi:choline dehydrogenase-like flavoprotein